LIYTVDERKFFFINVDYEGDKHCGLKGFNIL